ncbi:ribonuclease D [Gracilimonas mengyeensis]|uniref:Ribonuclease D n=1 Tax=Gracilimonas mengyeensis TaxID=1302730 RepID=A0A521F0W9_9BACT|nr:ribonuclease D [Gracilimonas mengyeensis]SMO89716.1 ribonuclease D [Gracilimonas mengyeensis]
MTIHYIDTDVRLRKLTDALSHVSAFAIDLEFDRNRYRYGFNMCLMQIYDGQDCYLVDPLSEDVNIDVIFPVLENPEVQKVVFAFGEDLRLLHSMGCFPKNIYDLDVATSLLNFEPASLTNLIKDVLEVEVNSSSQQSNWYKRPLSDQQKEYAADDVLYLLDFKDALESKISGQKVQEWVQQENAIFDKLDYSDEDHNTLIKDKDKNDMTMFEWHVYKHLMNFFDEVAESYNKPVYQLVNKRLVESLALNPKKVNEWQRMKGIFGALKNDSFQQQLKQEIQEAVEDAKSQNLSTSRKASHTLNDQEYRAMRQEQSRISHLKAKLMRPIQNKIADDFGKHAKSFILPNRLAKEIIAGETEMMPDYKVQLFRRYAKDLDIDLSEYI